MLRATRDTGGSDPRPRPRLAEAAVTAASLLAIAVHFVLRAVAGNGGEWLGIARRDVPLVLLLVFAGLPMTARLAGKLVRGQFSSDLLAGLSIVTALVLREYLAGALVVLMLSGGETLEQYAVRRASSALGALARRMPRRAHRREDGELGTLRDIETDAIAVGDEVVVFPHEICPADGTVLSGRSAMDESYLTGEPYVLAKAPGAAVLSGAVNGEGVLTIRVERAPVDSRYAKIMQVMSESEQRRPHLRRLGDQLGAIYTPIAVSIALAAWMWTGNATRFLAVIVVATPCPLLIGIPVAIIGSVSLAARRGIIIKDPSALERIATCRTAMFDKTGTLTYGQPQLTEVLPATGHTKDAVLGAVASLERYSRHPLAEPILEAARAANLRLEDASQVSEHPGQGLLGVIGGQRVQVSGRKDLPADASVDASELPPPGDGLECVVTIDGRYAGLLRFRDEPRAEGRRFVRHLSASHGISRALLVSGDRDSEVRYLAAKVAIDRVYAGQSPEEKLALVREETRKAPTLFVGDGINDAPALTAATVGVAFGSNVDVAAEAAGVVVMDQSLERVDELLHIGRRMRSIALQSAVGGIALSVAGMILAAAGALPPTAGALAQEVIDVLAVLNALRTSWPPRVLSDY